jgi:hypothetical protein
VSARDHFCADRSLRLNTGGWLLLTVIFSALLMLVQRAERKRRVVTMIVMVFVASTVVGYGIYRISNQCDYLKPICNFTAIRQNAQVVAWNTVNMAAFAALIFNFLFWFLIGRYNPPGSSDDIKVLGMND